MKELTPIWQEIWDALAWNMPDQDKTPLHRFNRLAKEHFPIIEEWLDQETCIARYITLSEEDVKQLQPWHTRPNPRRHGGNLILFSLGGNMAIVDGNNRVAYYIENSLDNDINAILVELRSH